MFKLEKMKKKIKLLYRKHIKLNQYKKIIIYTTINFKILKAIFYIYIFLEFDFFRPVC